MCSTIFGLTKIVTKKDGKAEPVEISKLGFEEKPPTCKLCRERFWNAGALSIRIKCKHNVVISQPGEQSSNIDSPVIVNVTDGEELEGPSMETSSLETSGKWNAGDKKNKHYNEHYYKDNLHLVVKVNEKLAKAIKTAFNVGTLKQAGMPATLAETPSPTTRRPATSRRVPKHQKERQKQKPKHQQYQVERQLPQEEIQKNQEG